MNAQQIPNPWLVFNVGCIECGVSSNIVGMYATEDEADRVAAILDKKMSWREGGQNSFQVFNLLGPQAEEYQSAIAKATGGAE